MLGWPLVSLLLQPKFTSRNSRVNNLDLALPRQPVNAVDAERLSILAFNSALTFSQTRTNNFPMPCLFPRR